MLDDFDPSSASTGSARCTSTTRMTPLGSNRDRHANLGEGEIGEAGSPRSCPSRASRACRCIFEGPGAAGRRSTARRHRQRDRACASADRPARLPHGRRRARSGRGQRRRQLAGRRAGRGVQLGPAGPRCAGDLEVAPKRSLRRPARVCISSYERRARRGSARRGRAGRRSPSRCRRAASTRRRSAPGTVGAASFAALPWPSRSRPRWDRTAPRPGRRRSSCRRPCGRRGRARARSRRGDASRTAASAFRRRRSRPCPRGRRAVANIIVVAAPGADLLRLRDDAADVDPVTVLAARAARRACSRPSPAAPRARASADARR